MNFLDRVSPIDNAEHYSHSEEGYIKYASSPQMGFTIKRKNGAIDAFFYHSIDNLDISIIRDIEHLTFTHRRKMIVIQGKNMGSLLTRMLEHIVSSISDTTDAAPGCDEPIVDAILIGSVENRDMELE